MTTSPKWSATDPRHFEHLSLSALQGDLARAERFAKDYPQFEFGWHNEYRSELKRRIAEMIGKKK